MNVMTYIELKIIQTANYFYRGRRVILGNYLHCTAYPSITKQAWNLWPFHKIPLSIPIIS